MMENLEEEPAETWDSRAEQEEEMLVGEGLEDWNGFISGGTGGGEAEEEDLVTEWRPGEPVRPQHVLKLNSYTKDYLCSPEDNIYNVSFSCFKIRDVVSGAVILDIKKLQPTDADTFIKALPGGLEFTVGSKALSRFHLIERHFYRNLLLKTFDFEIGFCIPHSRNTCEHIYCLPDLDSNIVEEMIRNPFETRSDSFYFVNNKLMMHHKAEYSFTGTDSSRE
uniref:Unc-119 lipid binding chaperone c n=1 Tax=Amphiprion percula TaxID=161767 RepID=A0A3P8S7V2_AMPPE